MLEDFPCVQYETVCLAPRFSQDLRYQLLKIVDILQCLPGISPMAYVITRNPISL